jgi:hypothetical protein
LPDKPGEVVPDESVEDAASFLCLEEFFVNAARVGKRFPYGIFGDLVEDDAFWIFYTQDLGNMPGDGFPFTIGVGRENHAVGFLCFVAEFGDDLLFLLDDLVVGDEAALDIDRTLVALREITNVSHGGSNGVSVSEILFNCFRL